LGYRDVFGSFKVCTSIFNQIKGGKIQMKSKSYLTRLTALLFVALLLAACKGETTVTPPTAPTTLSWDQTNWGQTNWQ